ncbi:IclR family transcriptional regulator [Cupriavidus oxalaticus]|uniref:IclR family transcriptional regulator n=2 Tax=Burkholderiaceae TaxID=119060 RepID=A0A4P7L4P6_9BURK|nr:IclR family transcriptional regulator [Cupriavidus oxalaticus]TDF64129.1 IclR family transcriptional regulator [Cupriavidus sp. L7L]
MTRPAIPDPGMTVPALSLGAILDDLRSAPRPLTSAEYAYLAHLRQRIVTGDADLWTTLETAGVPCRERRLSPEVMQALTAIGHLPMH